MNVCLKIVRLFLPLGNALTCVYVSICISSSFPFNLLTHLLSLSLSLSLFLSLSLSSSLPQHICKKKNPLPLFYSPFLSHCLSFESLSENPGPTFIFKTIRAQHYVSRSIRMNISNDLSHIAWQCTC